MARPTAITATELERTARLDYSLRLLNELSTSALHVPVEDFLNQAARSVCEFFSVPVCVIWSVNEDRSRLRIIATYGEVDDKYKQVELESVVVQPEAFHRSTSVYSKNRGWATAVTTPVYVDNQLIGMIELCALQPREFQQWETE